MVNLLVFIFTGVMIGCWILSVADKTLHGAFKLALTVAIACFVGVVNLSYVLSLISFIACICSIIVTVGSVALCKAAKES
jgi:hypothetical protein